MIPCRTDRSILKVIVCCLAQSALALLYCCHRGSRLTKMQHGGHMQGTEAKGVGERLDDETSGSAGFSGIKTYLHLRDNPVLLDPHLLDFPVQRRAGNSQFRCRTVWVRSSPLTPSARAFQLFLSPDSGECLAKDLLIPAGVAARL
jgi:hypothetical protein